MSVELDDALSNLALAAAQLTDEQLVGAVRKARTDDPLVEELVERFAARSAESHLERYGTGKHRPQPEARRVARDGRAPSRTGAAWTAVRPQ